MNVCGFTRVLVPAALTGMAVSTVFGRDLYGVAAAVAVGIVLWLVERWRGTSASCGVTLPPADAEAVEPLARLDGQLKTVSTKRSNPS